MTQFIRRGGTLINPDHVARIEIGPATPRGIRPAVLFDARGVEIGTVQEADVAGLPGFVRVGDTVINTRHVVTAEQVGDKLRLFGQIGVLATIAAAPFLAAIDRAKEAA